MTTTSVAARTTGRDLARQLTVAVSAVLAVIGSFIGSGAAGGQPVQDAAGGALAADATLIAPGAGAFGIWSVIYLGLLATMIGTLSHSRSNWMLRIHAALSSSDAATQ